MTDMKKLDLIEKRIHAITSKRARETEELNTKIEKARESIAEADKIRTAAEESMNMEMFRNARIQREEAQDAVDLYGARLKLLESKEDIDEPASDETIDELLQIQTAHDIAFDAKADRLISEINEFLAEYEATNTRIEQALNSWHYNIKPNRRLDGVGSVHEHVQPVHSQPRTTWKYKQLARFASTYKNSLSYRGDELY